MDIFSFLRQLESNMPLTRQKITDMGFELTKIEKGPRRGDYCASPIALNDGIRLRHIILSMRNVESGISLFLIINIENEIITPQEKIMKRILVTLAMLFFVASCQAGDIAEFRPLGFSESGQYYAFAQMGVHDGSGVPYAELWVIDVLKNEQAATSAIAYVRQTQVSAAKK